MNDEIRSLIESLRRGQYEDPSEKISLLAAALQEHKAESDLILSLLRSPQVPLRLAAIEACRGRVEANLLDEFKKLVGDAETRVRARLADVLGSLPENVTAEPLKSLVEDSDDAVRLAAVKSTSGRPTFSELQRSLLVSDPDWEVRVAAAAALGEQKVPAIVRELLIALANDEDKDVQQRCAELLEKRLTHAKASVEKHLPTDITLLSKADRSLKELGGRRFPRLLEWIHAHTTVEVSPQELAKFGTDLTALAANATLPHAYRVEETCETLLAMLRREQWRSIVLLGEASVGKSAVVNELVYHLARPEHGGWRVLRVSPSDFMAGTHYMGEWETKVRDLVQAVKKPRRVLIYVPNLSDLSAAGRWSKSDSNVATALAPYVEEGTILLLGESPPAEFERGLGGIPSLQRLFDKVLLKEASLDQTRRVLKAIRDDAQVPLTDEVLGRLLDLATQYLSHLNRPGNAASLLRAMISGHRDGTRPVSLRDVLQALSKSTGIPADLLDDSIPLKLDDVKAFFEQRIMGQPEAVEAVVDLVTLIKAGLTDPHKPFGVFLFVGPTGVGKTELARALAEFIFGDATRLKRFDMSEYASPQGFERLIGGKNENGLLTDAVRQHPFSVVLLDEIEKSHPNVFDLCLQIFDAGRLTDGHGRTVDFRRSIVILTSNIGAAAPNTPLGFNLSAQPDAPDANKDRTLRELTRFFRPEFLNRIDRIIAFRPLALEVAERIARREIDLVLQRSGIARRELAVDVDPSLIGLLVKEGYSPHFGARPLKRTVERLCLLPLARAIATGRILGQAVLCLTQRGGKVEVRTTEAAAPAKPDTAPKTPQEPLRETVRQLHEAFLALELRVQPLADRKSELLQRTQDPGFYRDQRTRQETFDEIHKLDQFLAWRDRLRMALERLQNRTAREPLAGINESLLREQVDEFSGELDQLSFVASCRDARNLGDTLLCVSLVDSTGESQRGVEKICGMYLALAARRRMSGDILGEYYDSKTDRAYLEVGGLGAYAMLKQEAGLHRLDHRYRSHASRTGREKQREDREVIRVEVMSVVSEPDRGFVASVKAKVQPLKPVKSRLVKKANLAVSLFHEPSLRSLEVWTAGQKDAAVERVRRILWLQIQGVPENNAPARAALVRQYDLGISARVKDLRTGKATSRVEQVFKGRLELFLNTGTP